MPPTSVQLNGNHAITSDAVFTDLRASHFERRDFDVLFRLPTRDDAPHPTSLMLGDIWTVHWIRPEAPFMMLVPTNRRPFDGPLFSRLDFIHNIPLHQSEDRSWSLRSDVIRDWHALEHNLHAVWWAMLKKSDARSPAALRYWAWPHRYGYHLTYRSRSDANIIATRSRNAFIPLMASITFFIIQLDYFATRYGEGFVEWRRDVIAAADIHPQWFSDLESSIVGDLSAARIGGIVDVSCCQFLWLLPSLRKLNMPLLLHWGPIKQAPDSIPSWLEPLAPTSTIIGQLRSIERNFTGRTYSPEPNVPTPVFPPVERFSQQRQSESMKQFFARRAQEGRNIINAESPEKRVARLQRDAATARHMAPGKHGARVYYWEDVNGFRIRKAAGRKNYESYWEEDAEYKRRFDPVFNEWDVCSEFTDSDAGSDAHDDHDADMQLDYDRDQDVSNSYPLLPEEDSFFKVRDQFPSSADLECIHPVDTLSATQDHSDTFDTTHMADDVAYSRFGFIGTRTDSAAPKATWKSVTKALGVSWDDNSQPSPKVRNAMETFFGHHKGAKTYTDIPRDLYDLMDNDADVHRGKVSVRRETLDQEYYFLYRSGHHNSFELGVTNAATVVQVLRHQWGPDLSEVARELLARGIHFHTFIRGSSIPPPRPQLIPRFRGLGYRPAGYKPDRLDYAAYLDRRNRLLSSPCGRAALLHGGLIARFARGVVKFDEVLDGPSRNVTQDGRLFRHAHTPGVGFWDDGLTEDDIDILCGVYQVAIGELYLSLP
jgi:hypothetical protein